MPTYTHGVTYYFGAAGTTYGLSQSFSENQSVEVAEARDSDGDVAAVATYNTTAEFSQEVVIGAATLPTAGSVVAVAGATTGNALVTGVTLNHSNTDYQRLTIAGRRWKTNGIPA